MRKDREGSSAASGKVRPAVQRMPSTEAFHRRHREGSSAARSLMREKEAKSETRKTFRLSKPLTYHDVILLCTFPRGQELALHKSGPTTRPVSDPP